MHHSNELAFTFIMMLHVIFSRCSVSLNNYSTSTLYHWPVFML